MCRCTEEPAVLNRDDPSAAQNATAAWQRFGFRVEDCGSGCGCRLRRGGGSSSSFQQQRTILLVAAVVVVVVGVTSSRKSNNIHGWSVGSNLRVDRTSMYALREMILHEWFPQLRSREAQNP